MVAWELARLVAKQQPGLGGRPARTILAFHQSRLSCSLITLKFNGNLNVAFTVAQSGVPSTNSF